MDNPFLVKLTDICSQAVTEDEELRKVALQKCIDLNLSNREELILATVFNPTPANVLGFISLYETYLPYIRGEVNAGKVIASWSEANQLLFNFDTMQTVDFFGTLLRSVFIWNGQKKYEQVAREVARKLEQYTDKTFDFDDLLDESWAQTYNRFTIILVAENLAFLDDPTQMMFVGTKMFFDAIMFGMEVDSYVGSAVDFYVYIDQRADRARDLATFLYANDQDVGFNSDTGEPVKLAYWIDKFRIFSNKKFDGLSLINFVQDDNQWGEANDDFEKIIIKNTLMIYGHLISGHYVFPEMSEIDKERIRKKLVAEKTANEVAADLTDDTVSLPDRPSDLIIRQIVLGVLPSNLSEEDRVTGILNVLSELSEQYNDPTIVDLYYFDEEEGVFKWRE